MPDWLTDWLGAISLAVVTGVTTWLAGISRRVNRHSTQLAVHEAKMDEIPKGLEGIKDEIRGLREDGRERAKALYEHMDKMRIEIKDDLKGKVDK